MSGCKAAARRSNCERVMTVLQSAALWDAEVELGLGFAVLLAAGASQMPCIVITGSSAPTWPLMGTGTAPLGRRPVALRGAFPGLAGAVAGRACASPIEVRTRIARLRKCIVCSLRSDSTHFPRTVIARDAGKCRKEGRSIEADNSRPHPKQTFLMATNAIPSMNILNRG